MGDASCDADGDRIPDQVEMAVCGSALCATGHEDVDNDGVADWVEFQASGRVDGADPAADANGNRVPDFAEVLSCGHATCSGGVEDGDRDGVPDWIEVVICGDTTCATGTEDYDADGVADAVTLAACWRRPGDPSPAPGDESPPPAHGEAPPDDEAVSTPGQAPDALALTGLGAAGVALLAGLLVCAGVMTSAVRRQGREPETAGLQSPDSPEVPSSEPGRGDR